MTVRYLPMLDRERWYVIDVDYEAETRRPGMHRLLSLHGPNCEASLSYNLFSRGFGIGVEFGRNGGESDVGLSIYLGRLASVWLRLRAPFTRWLRVSKERDPDGWYNARHTGVRLFPFDGAWFQVKIEDREGTWTRGQPWWRDWHIGARQVLGPVDCETTTGAPVAVRVPLPEGAYDATVTEERRVWRYRRWPGRLRDLAVGPRQRVDYSIDIPGGIPIEGKGENSWDCGMDGLFRCGGRTVEEAIGSAVSHVLRDRRRYGGPHDLSRPMSVREAGAS